MDGGTFMDFGKLENKFEFQGQEYTYMDLKEFETVKSFYESSHHDKKLVKSPDGKLFLYVFDEYVNFSGPDIMNEYFILVSDEADAENLANQQHFVRKPLIHVKPNFDIEVR